MPQFHYKAAGANGELVEGQLEALNEGAAVKRLQALGHVPIRIEEDSGGGTARMPRLRLSRRRAGSAEVDIFTLELSTLLQSGLPLDKALDLMVTLAENEALRQAVARIHAAVRRGSDLSSALQAEGRLFSPFYLNMVKAGEASGALDAALARVSEFMSRARALRETLVSALLYPLILLAFSAASLALILGVVIPRITQMFADAGQELPLSTQIVVGVGAAANTYWWVGALLLGLGVVVVRLKADDLAWRQSWDRRFLTLPIAGALIAKYEAARFTRTLGTLLENGVPLLDGIGIAKAVVANRIIAMGLERVAASVRAGQGLAKPLIEAEIFPRLAGRLMQVGEQTGNLQDMLLRVADIYDREVETSLKRAVDLLGPLLILFLGMLIAGIIMSVLAAILSVNELAF